MAYGQKFKEIRRSNLLSQEEFAKQVGVSRSVISQIEIDKIKPTLDALKRISKLYNVSLDYLMSNEEPPSEEDKNVLLRQSIHAYPNFQKSSKILMEFTPASLFGDKLSHKRLKEIPYFSLSDRRNIGFPYPFEDIKLKLPQIQIPIDAIGPLMAFEILDPNTFQNEILVCHQVDINVIHEQQFIVIIAMDKLLHGTIEQIDAKSITLGNSTLQLTEIREIWQVKLVIAPPDLHNSLKEQLKKMELMLEELRRR